MKLHIPLLLVTLALSSCYKTIEIDNFDASQWKKDRNACDDIRSNIIDSLYNHRDELIGQKQQEIERFLGKPNRLDVDARMRKTFHYYYSPSTKCDSAIKDIKAISIEFESMNRVRFVSKAEF